jgi:hypothetical protein
MNEEAKSRRNDRDDRPMDHLINVQITGLKQEELHIKAENDYSDCDYKSS